MTLNPNNKQIDAVITLAAFADEISPNLQTQMDVLSAEGIYHIDLRTLGGKNVLKLTDGEVTEIKEQLDARGFKIASIATPIGNISIKDDFTPQLKDLARAIELAHYFGTPYIRIFSYIIPKGEDKYKYRDEVLRRLQALTSITEQEGVILVIDNDTPMYVNNGERARDILGTINSPNLRLAFDPANFIQSMVIPMKDAYPLVEPYISYIHMKDARVNTGEVVPAGEGDAEIRKLLAALKEKKYSGVISIEPKGRPGVADPDFFMAAAKALKTLLKEAGIKYQHIASPDLNVARRPVNLPSSTDMITTQITTFPPACPMPMIPSNYLKDWIPLASLDQMAETEYDVLIVGTGAGGGAALWRLCEQWQKTGKRIGVIERGDFVLPTQARNLPTMDSDRLNRLFHSVSQLLPGSLPEYSGGRQLFAVGGRTLFWNTISPRMNLSQIAKWPVSLEEMDAYYHIAEQVMTVTHNYTQGSSMTEILLDRLHQLGFPEAMAVPMAADLQPRIYAKRDSDVFFSSMVFLAQALNRRPFDLAVRARAVQVLSDNGKVVGVQVMSPDKKTYNLKARHVILSASTFETPRLLLHSGIQGRAIGHYLTNHSSIRATGKISRQEFPEVLGTLGILMPGTASRPYQIQLRGPDTYDWHQTYQKEPFMDEMDILFLGSGKVESRFENKVTLDRNRIDEYGVPEIRVRFSYSETDQAVIRQTMEAINQISAALGITLISGDGMPAICLMPPGDLHHDSGTCRMGDEPLTSATNRYGQIHGVSGLYVADNSVLPSVGTANVTLTTVALAIRTADYIIRQE